MNPYLTPADLRARLERVAGLLYDDHGQLNESWMQADLDAVAAQLHAHLGRRYTLPVSAPEGLALLRDLALDLAHELALRRHPAAPMPPAVREAASRARATLRALGNGSLSLPGVPVAAEPGGHPVLSEANPPLFTRRRLGGF